MALIVVLLLLLQVVYGDPVCNAGGPYEATCTNQRVRVALLGSASHASTFLWQADGFSSTVMDPTLSISTSTGSCINQTYDVSLEVTDSDGDSADCKATVTINDSTKPKLLGLYAEDMTVECDDIPVRMHPTAKDNCDGEIDVAFNEAKDDEVDEDQVLYKLTRTWTANDICGNQAKKSQVITVKDTNAPTISGVEEGNVYSTCNTIPPCEPAAFDTCSEVSIAYDQTTKQGSCLHSYDLHREWTASDDNGNTAVVSQTVKVRDTDPPTLSGVPQDTTVECDAIPETSSVSASDECDDTVSVVFEGDVRQDGTCLHAYTITRSWSARDNCGNVVEKAQTISVQDTTAPVLTNVPEDVSVPCNAVPDPCPVVVTDNCDENVSLSYTQTKIPGSCESSYELVRTWSATDECGNAATQEQTVTVTDTDAPKFKQVPAPYLELPCDGVADVDLVAEDTCPGDVTVTKIETQQDSDNNDVWYEIIRHWTATDSCGNQAETSQTVQVNEGAPPLMHGLPKKQSEFSCDQVPNPPSVSATDDCCADDEVSVTFTHKTVPGGCDSNYTLIWTWEATDCADHLVTSTHYVHIYDAEAPTLSSEPADVSAPCNNIPDADLVSASDNCDSVSVIDVSTINPGSCPNEYEIVRTWTVQDDCNHGASHTQIVSVYDDQAPVLSNVPSDDTADCLDNMPTPSVTATDNCDGEISITTADNSTNGTCEWSTTRTYCASDECGNSRCDGFTISFSDSTAPSWGNVSVEDVIIIEIGQYDDISFHPDYASSDLEATDDCNPVTTTYDESKKDIACNGTVYTLYRSWIAEDDCGHQSNELTQTISVRDTSPPSLDDVDDVDVQCHEDSSPSPFPEGSDDNGLLGMVEEVLPSEVLNVSCPHKYVRKWRVRDLCHYTTYTTQTITIDDITPPNILAEYDATQECGPDPHVEPNVTATDNCEANPDVAEDTTHAHSFPVNDCDTTYVNRYDAWDDCGNTDTVTTSITVIDTTPPEFVTFPNDTHVECGDSNDYGSPTAYDNCSDASVAYADETVPGTCPFQYTLVRTWTASDCAGNSVTRQQTIYFTDNNPPTFSGQSAYAGLCGSDPDVTDPQVEDDCEGYLGSPSRSESGNYYDGLVITWSHTDACGNFASVNETLYWSDYTPPAIDPIDDETVDCYEDVPTEPQLMVYEMCSYTVEFDETESLSSCNDRFIFREWKVTDDSGNMATEHQTITVHDSSVLAWVSPEPDNPLVLQWDENLTIPEVQLELNDTRCTSTSINCELTELYHTCDTNYTLRRTCTGTDECGESITFEQDVIVYANYSEFEHPDQNQTVIECKEDYTLPTVTYGGVALSPSNVPTPSYCGSTIVFTYEYADSCEQVSWTYTVIEEDTTPPTLTGVPSDDSRPCNETHVNVTVTATDDCTTASVSHSWTTRDTTEAELEQHRALTAREDTWVGTDECGNTESATATTFIVDVVPPELHDVPDDHNVTTPGTIPVAPVSASDNCDYVTPEYNETRVNGTCLYQYTMIRTWTATDLVGNTVEDVQTIEVADVTPPIFTPATVTEELGPFEWDSVPDAINVTATDDFDGDVDVDYVEVKIDGVDDYHYTLNRTWTATDTCGNQAIMQQVVTVHDITPPLINIPANITIECDGGYAGPDNATQFILDDMEANASLTITTTKVDGTCENSYTLIHTWTMTDGSGNTNTSSQFVTIVDTVAPQWQNSSELPTQIHYECDEPVFPNLTAIDNCMTDYSGQEHEVDVAVDTQYNEYTMLWTTTWTATDLCGHTIEHTLVYSVTDTEKPYFDTPLPDNYTNYKCIHEDAEELTGGDDCNPTTISVKTVEIDENCTHEYTLMHTWTITDDAGHYATFSQIVTVVDDTPPVFSSTPEDYDVNSTCDDIAPPEVLSYSDDCDPEEVQVEASVEETDWEDQRYFIIRTWTAQDVCGNKNVTIQTVTVYDVVPPSIDIGEDYTVECTTVSAPVPSVDDCSLYSVDMISSGNLTSCGDLLAYFWTFKAVDEAGNEATDTVTVSVVDTTPPTLSIVLPTQTEYECDEPDPPSAHGSDTCEGDLTPTFDRTHIDGSSVYDYSIVWTWSLADNCGNQADDIILTIHVNDNESPYFNVTLENDEVPCTDTLDVPPVDATDDCGEVSVTFDETSSDDGCNVTWYRTWTATDSNGNEDVMTQTVIVYDTNAPVLAENYTAPEDGSAECDLAPATLEFVDTCHAVSVVASSEDLNDYTTIYTWVAEDECGLKTEYDQTITIQDVTPPVFENTPPSFSWDCNFGTPNYGDATADDNCGVVSVSKSTADGQGDCVDGSLYVTYVTWTATDDSGNVATNVTTVTVTDTTPPVFTGNLTDKTSECAALQFDPLEATDDCSAYSVSTDVTFVEEPHYNGCPNVFMVKTWDVVDECGNAGVSQVQSISVYDVTPPTLSNVPVDQEADCSEDQIEVDAQNQHVTADDTCDQKLQAHLIDSGVVPGSCIYEYSLYRTWTATDECGNSVTDSATITVSDNSPPVLNIQLPDEEEFPCDDIPEEPSVTVDDNCDGDELSYQYTNTSDQTDTNTYQVIRSWSASDSCGNTDSKSQTINVYDVEPPILEPETVDDATVECHEIPPAPSVTATDNCDTDVSVVFTSTNISGSCPHAYQIAREWTVSDSDGNSRSMYQTITVQDTNAPVITPTPSDLVVECPDVPDPPTLTADDNCTEDMSVEITSTRTPDDGSQYQIIRVITAVDECGNSAEHIQTVDVIDTVPPVVTGPSDETNEYPAVTVAYVGSAQAYDNCSDVTPVFNETKESGDCLYHYTLFRSWTATDEAGNSYTHETTVTVQDTTPPVLHGVPEDASYQIGEVPDLSDVLFGVTATDNSGAALVVGVNETYHYSPGGSPHEYNITRTFYVEDDCGNAAVVVQLIVVYDTTPPDLKEYPKNETVECDAIPIPCIVETIDEVNETIETSYNESIIDGTVESGTYIITRRWTAVDAAGNVETHIQTITVQDTSPPVLSRYPEDMNVSCNCDTFPSAAEIHALDNCDESVSVIFDESKIDDSPNDHNYVLVRTWTATDQAGNSVSHSQTVTVTDEEAPVLSKNPEDMSVQCDHPILEHVTSNDHPSNFANIYVRDNCDPDVVLVYTHTVTSNADFDSSCDNYLLERTWSATDASGNMVSYTQSIVVEDSSAPSFEEQPPVYLGAMADMKIVVVSVADSFSDSQLKDILFPSTDSCDEEVDITLSCNSTQTTSDDSPSCRIINDEAIYMHQDGIHFQVWATLEDNCNNVRHVKREFTLDDTHASTDNLKFSYYNSYTLE
jgi:hypothetical protein